MQPALLWLGAGACAIGLASQGILDEWSRARTRESLVLVLLMLAAGWLGSRVGRVRVATAVAAAWALLLPVYAGPLPVASMLLFALAAAAVGGGVAPDAPLAARCTLGLAIVAGALGWLLPLPVHHPWSYALVLIALVAWRSQDVVAALRGLRGGWTQAVASAPRTAAFAVVLVGLASTACWVPTLQHDDVGYHLRLPWMLLEDGRHALDPEFHAWALAPWASDVVHAVPQVLAGTEARGAVNALWLVLAASGLWQLAAALGGDAGARWWSVAVFASLPLTTALGLGMQTEVQTTALLAWVAAYALRPPSTRTLLACAALLGGLAGSKVAAALFAAVLLPWLLWRQRAAVRPLSMAAAGLLALAIGGSSYAYAAWIAGNPVLPLLNATFQSPYFAPVDFVDPRWHAGFGPALPWNLTFDTDRYLESHDGGGGFVLVALAGAWLLALRRRRTRAVALLAVACMGTLLAATQYLRYVQPALVLAIPALVVAARQASPRTSAWLLAGLCALNLAFLASGHWQLRAGVVKHAAKSPREHRPVFEMFAPERALARAIRAGMASAPGNVLSLDPSVQMVAELGVHARSVGWYDPSLQDAAAAAESDATGHAWARLLRGEGVRHVLLRPATVTPAQRAGLQRVGAAPRARVGPAEWWQIDAGAQ